MLEAASVSGEEFSAAIVAAAAAVEEGAADEICERLARRRQFIEAAGLSEWPDGTLSSRYRFQHALYRDAVTSRVPPGRQALVHQRIAQRLEQAYGSRADEVAEMLALHFEMGCAPQRAIHYLQRAARKYASQAANVEAATALSRAMKLLPRLPEEQRTAVHIDLLDQRGLLYRSMGDVRASLEDLGALAAVAAEVRLKVRALLGMADQIAWSDTDRCLHLLEQALDLSNQAGEYDASLAVRGYLGYKRATRRRWTDKDADACLAALPAAGRDDEYGLVRSSRAAHILILRSEYRAAVAVAAAGVEGALHRGDITEYLTLHFNWGTGLLFLGHLGEALDVCFRAMDVAEKNGHYLWASMLRDRVAMIYREACCFTRARELGEEVMDFAQGDPVSRKMVLQRCRLGLGFVYRELGDSGRALQHFQSLSEADCQDLEILATRSYGLSECWLALGKAEPAAAEAERLIDLLTPMRHRTLIALARRVRARAAMSVGKWQQATREIARALTVLGEGDPSVSMWRVLATAAEIYLKKRREKEARLCLSQSAMLIGRIADGLHAHTQARQDFLAHPEARRVLEWFPAPAELTC